MKALLFVFAVTATATMVHGQGGTIAFSNSSLTRVMLRPADGGALFGVPISMAINYGVFWGTSLDTLSETPVLPLGTNSSTASGIIAASSIYVISGTQPGQTVFMRVRGWSAEFGADWQAAVNREGSYFGETDVRQVTLGLTDGPGTVIWQGASGTGPNRFNPLVLDEQAPGLPPFCSPRKAVATAQVVNGFVVGATMTDGGCGYTNAPAVLIQGGGGTGATARAEISGGRVTAIQIISAGCCYTNTPRIAIASPPFVPTLSIRASKVKVSQNVVLGRRYVLESSNDLVAWLPTDQPFTAESEILESEFDVNTVGRFFRIREVP